MVQIQLVNGWPFANVCGQLTNCTLNHDAIGDPDIAGIGVLLAFMLTAVITVLTVFLAYWTESLPPNRYTELDDAAISVVRKIMHLSEKPPASHSSLDETALLQRSSRIEAVERFMLALSDQQLVTAISLLIAAYGRICVISGYSFQIVAASAWFSCTTHLSTLTVLRRYFDDHKVLRTIRIILMMLLFLFLCITMTLAQLQVLDLGDLALCRIQPRALKRGPLTAFGVSSSILTFILWLSYGYGRTITEIFSQQYRVSTKNWLSWVIIKIMLPASASWPNEKARYKVLGVPSRVFGTVYQSFLWEIVLLWLYLTYGLVLMLSSLIVPGNQVFKAGGMGFGQILPLALLGLPVLAACEAYYEWMDRLNKPLVESSEHVRQDSTSTKLISKPIAGIPLDELLKPDSSNQQRADSFLTAGTSDLNTTSTEHLVTPRGGTELDSESTESCETGNFSQLQKLANNCPIEGENTQSTQSGILVVIPELTGQHASDTAVVEDIEHLQVPRVNTLELEEARRTSSPTDIIATQQRQLVLAPTALTRREKITATVILLLYFLTLQFWAITNNSLIYKWMHLYEISAVLGLGIFSVVISFLLIWIVGGQPILDGINVVYKVRRNQPVNKATTARG